MIAAAAEVAAGRVHQIPRFLQPYGGAPGSATFVDKILDGPDYPEFRSDTISDYYHGAAAQPQKPFWGTGPTCFDVNQGELQNCPTTSSWQALARFYPAPLEEVAVDLGDGTYALHASGHAPGLYARIDGEINEDRCARIGLSGRQWWPILEKAVFDLGYSPMTSADDAVVYHLMEPEALFERYRQACAAGQTVRFFTNYRPDNAVLGVRTAVEHYFSLMDAWRADDGTPMFCIRNPYGLNYERDWPPADPTHGLRRVTLQEFSANFDVGYVGTPVFPRPPVVLAAERGPYRQLRLGAKPDPAREPWLDGALLPDRQEEGRHVFPPVPADTDHAATWPDASNG